MVRVMLDKDVTQFALLSLKDKNGREVKPLVAAAEFEYLEEFGGSEVAVSPQEDDYVLSICYGRYLFNSEVTKDGEPLSKQTLIDLINQEVDKWLIGISNKQTHFMGIKDIVIIDKHLERKCCHHSSCNGNHVDSDTNQAGDLAIAVLVSSKPNLQDLTSGVIYDESDAVDRLDKFKSDDFKPSAFTLFLNVHGYTVFSNIVNRVGAYALAHTLPISEQLSEENWTQFINHDDAYLVASRVM